MCYQEYIKIWQIKEKHENPCFQGSKINFYYSVATPLIDLLIKEIKEALFDVKDLM